MILPELRGTIEFYVVIASTTVLAFAFAYVWTITQGGPGDATTTLEVYIYNTGEVQSLPGQAAAVATMLLGVMLRRSSRCCSGCGAGAAREAGGDVSAATPTAPQRQAASRTCRSTSCWWVPRCSRSSPCCSCS